MRWSHILGMNPASSIVSKFGGVPVVAAAIGVPNSTVLRWTYPREKGGTGGAIPTKRQQQILDLAKELGVELAPADFFGAAA